MYTPQDYLDAIEQTTPEAQSKAIVALQGALQKQQNLIQAVAELERVLSSEAPLQSDVEKCIAKVRKVNAAYYKV